MKKILTIPFLFLLFLPLSLEARTMEGIIRNINPDKSKGFGLDVPPIIRVYTNSSTKFKNTSLATLKVGDKVQVKGNDMQPGTFIATWVKVVGHIEEERDLGKGTIKIEREKRFLMKKGQKAVLKEAGRPGIEIYAKKFINTLCKGGYDCSGPGYVGMFLHVRTGGEKSEIWLRSQGHRKPTSPVKVQIGSYEIQLVEAGEEVVLLVVR